MRPNRGNGSREHTTYELDQAIKGKREVMQWWEEQPDSDNKDEAIRDLNANIKRLQKLLDHRKNSPL